MGVLGTKGGRVRDNGSHGQWRESRCNVVHFHTKYDALVENWICNQIVVLNDWVAGVYSINSPTNNVPLFKNSRCFQRDIKGIPLFLNKLLGRVMGHRYPHVLIWLVKDRAKLIHAHFGYSGCYIWPFAKLMGIPLVTSFYGFDAYKILDEYKDLVETYRKLFKFGQVFLAEGSAMQKRLVELGCPEEKTVVHHVGVDPEKYRFCPREPNEYVSLLVCGRFVEKKGIPYAIEAIGSLISRGRKDIRLTVVGDSDPQGTITAEKEKILRSIEKRGFRNAVKLAGFVPRDVFLKVLYDHHILVVPSVFASDGDAEGGFPVVITEACATGMPVVAFDHCDIGEIVRNGENGFIVPEGDVGALSERLEYLINRPKLWCKFGRSGRMHVEENYNIKKLNERLVKLYKRLL